uniref:GIY-YIG domain-containing protein n=1 Tax=Octopus bimaculoides TaxID=37653 RepID=A0A0L8FU15_OCTBM
MEENLKKEEKKQHNNNNNNNNINNINDHNSMNNNNIIEISNSHRTNNIIPVNPNNLNSTHPHRTCDCRISNNCVFNNKCIRKEVVYECIVSTQYDSKVYVGATKNNMKQRLNYHKYTFRNRNRRNSAELSSYIWELKDG